MFNLLQTRVSARALIRAAACCSAAGLGLAGAYVSADLVQRGLAQSRAQRLGDSAAAGFTEAALRSHSAGMDPGALSIAQRHDPSVAVAAAERSHQADLFAAALEQRAEARGLRGSAGLFTVSARPFRVAGALDSAREMECLAQAVYYEARGETPSGQAAVAQVVLNRVRHPAFPKSICGVVFQGAQFGRSCQFSFACDGSLHRTRDTGAWRRAQTVAARALEGFVMADVGNATHFHAATVGPNWGGMVRVAQVGLHVFYRFGGRGGAPGAFHEAYRPDSAPTAVYASFLPVIQAPHFLSPEPAKAETPAGEAAVAPKPAEPVAEAAAAPAPPSKGAVTAS